MEQIALSAEGLSKSFGGRMVIRALDLNVPKGVIFSLLGRNGAGKTTTIRMLLGLIRPSGGCIAINGYDLRLQRNAALGSIGSLVESPALYPNLTGRENLLLSRRLMDEQAMSPDEVLDLMDLAADAGRLVRSYSLGMRQRLAIGRALMARPSLLILDEPTNGLDPQGIAKMRAFIRSLPSEHGVTVILSSHLMSEVEKLADVCAVIENGSAVFQGSLGDLMARAKVRTRLEVSDVAYAKSILAQRGLCFEDNSPEPLTLSTALTRQDRAELCGLLVDRGVDVSGIWAEFESLESIFLETVEAAETGKNHA